MGYYSDAGLCLTNKAKQILELALVEAENSNPNYREIKNLFAYAERRSDPESGAIAYFWANTKWYASFAEVSFITDFIAKLEPSEFYFIRVGEDYEDTEIFGGFWENPLGMNLVRGIDFSS